MKLVASLPVVLGCLAACGGGSSNVTVTEVPPQDLPVQAQATLVQAPAPTATVAVTQALPMRGGEEWFGTYVCAQGPTNLELHIHTVMDDGTIDGVFEFAHDPSGASGSYRLHGTIDTSGNVHLAPSSWIQRPSGYVAVGMTGRVRGDAFTGRIDHTQCGGFSLRHQ